jgi:hypothetical protein
MKDIKSNENFNHYKNKERTVLHVSKIHRN